MIAKTILISGKQGSGKTTLAKGLTQQLTRKNVYVHNINFADPIKKMEAFCWGVLQNHGVKKPFIKDGYLLQFLGTEWGRNRVDGDVWVRALQDRIRKEIVEAYGDTEALYFIVSDCRFVNELDAFPKALRVRLNAPSDVRKARAEMWRDTDDHVSETALDHLAFSKSWDLEMDTGLMKPDECVTAVIGSLKFGKKELE